MSFHRWFTAAMLMAIALPASGASQIRASELGTVSQVVDGTRIVMQYSRPRARGRDSLFGKGDMKWGATWTPGANWATTIEASKNIKLNQRPIPKGKYSVWMVLSDATAWTMVLDPDARRYHEDRPDSSAKQIRIPVQVEVAPFTEVLTWSMPALRIDGGTLLFQWERARVALDVEVVPSLVMTLPESEAAKYVGTYTYTELDKNGKPDPAVKFTITHEDNTLKGQWDPDDPYMKKFALIRIAPDWFAPGLYDKNGKIYEVLRPEMTFEFTRKAGRLTFVLRSDEDHVWGTAVRKP